MDIPKKSGRLSSDESFNHQVRLNAEKTIKFARVRELLGGYNAQEILEILVDNAIKEYDDGQEPDGKYLPKQLRVSGEE